MIVFVLFFSIANVLSRFLAIDECRGGERFFCPLSTVPEATFGIDGGTLSSFAEPCCPAKYKQCQIFEETQYCRDLMYYTIEPKQGQNVELCPTTTPQCTCQLSLRAEQDLSLSFCPRTTNCCPTCECHGDPHCTSFAGKPNIWATCDDRDESCEHKPSTCEQTFYAGKRCQWKWNLGGKAGYCARDPTSTIPVMTMYRKAYKNYKNPSDPAVYTASVVLHLGVYGSIDKAVVTDRGASWQFFFVGKGKCRVTGNKVLNGKQVLFPAGKDRWILTNLESGLSVIMLCVHQGVGVSPTSIRWEVEALTDPWFDENDPIVDQRFDGFCATGQIPEAGGNSVSQRCSRVDRQLSLYFGCTSDVNVCKVQWCYQHASQLELGLQNWNPNDQKLLCQAYLMDEVNVNNFLVAVCSTSPLVSGRNYPVDPRLCSSNPECKKCMDRLMDFPDEASIVLTAQPIEPTQTPTIPCRSDLTSVGLARPQLQSFMSGIQVDYFDTNTNQWEPRFALLDEEIQACDGCRNPFYFNSSLPENSRMVQPGRYRVKQCVSSEIEDLCKSTPEYNSRVTFTRDIIGGVATTQSFRTLYDAGALVCSRRLFPGCPVDYKCCVWNSLNAGDTDEKAWRQCMIQFHGGETVFDIYPSCRFNIAVDLSSG